MINRLEERIFWMYRDQQGLYESGMPLTLDQLKNVFDGRESFDVEKFLASEDTTIPFEGGFRADDTFTIQEVGSPEELRHLMTWDEFDPWEDSCSSSMDLDFEYPDFVDEDLRRYDYLKTLTGYTDSDLPYRLGNNPTYDKYMELLNIAERDDAYNYSDKECAIFEIQHILNDEDDEIEELTIDVYNDILQEYGLTDYIIEDGISRKICEDLEEGLADIDASENGMNIE